MGDLFSLQRAFPEPFFYAAQEGQLHIESWLAPVRNNRRLTRSLPLFHGRASSAIG
jgi:hypothetical protein